MPARGSIGQWRPQKTGAVAKGDWYDKKVLIHVCKDGTFTYRLRSEPIFNGVALPAYSVDTVEEARALQMLLCFRVDNGFKHPSMKDGAPWYKLVWVRNSPDVEDGMRVFDLDHMGWITRRLHEVWTVHINSHRT